MSRQCPIPSVHTQASATQPRNRCPSFAALLFATDADAHPTYAASLASAADALASAADASLSAANNLPVGLGWCSALLVGHQYHLASNLPAFPLDPFSQPLLDPEVVLCREGSPLCGEQPSPTPYMPSGEGPPTGTAPCIMFSISRRSSAERSNSAAGAVPSM